LPAAPLAAAAWLRSPRRLAARRGRRGMRCTHQASSHSRCCQRRTRWRHGGHASRALHWLTRLDRPAAGCTPLLWTGGVRCSSGCQCLSCAVCALLLSAVLEFEEVWRHCRRGRFLTRRRALSWSLVAGDVRWLPANRTGRKCAVCAAALKQGAHCCCDSNEVARKPDRRAGADRQTCATPLAKAREWGAAG